MIGRLARIAGSFTLLAGTATMAVRGAIPPAETLADNPVLAERHETPQQHDARMQWFRDARFGMFIHWGLYSQYAGEWHGKQTTVNGCAEWIMCGARAPIEEYASAAKDFNPSNYDAEKWVLAAKDAGVRYIVITAKHHEGFAMFRTKASPFNIVDATPFKRDPLAELAAACRKHGIRLGFYYSQNLDWHHPGGGSGEWNADHKGDPERYVDGVVIPQVQEVLNNYGTIDVIWWDIPGGVINKARADRINATVLAANPNIIMNNRLGGGYHGDIETPEQHIPATGFPGKDWESCMTMNRTWGFNKFDEQWKSPETLLHNLCDIASKGGNYLLNVGPTPLGEIPPASLERLARMGQWLRVHGEAIYGTRASVFPKIPDWGRITQRREADGDTTIYAIVFTPPADGRIVLDLMNEVASVRTLDGSPAPAATSDGRRITIALTAAQREARDVVVAVKLKGAPERETVALAPHEATLTGGLRVETRTIAGLGQTDSEPNLGYWLDRNATATWTVRSKAARTVSLNIRLASKTDGNAITFETGDQKLDVSVPNTGSWSSYTNVLAGKLSFPAGDATITVRARTVHGEAPCNLGTVELITERQP